MNSEQNDSIHHQHDKSYKFLLSSKRIFLELLQSFVDRGWVEHIDEQHLTKVDKSYILQDFREQEADLVYQLRLKDRHVIFYVLVEMQSTVDFQMPYRLLLYMVEIWRDVLKNTDSDEAARKHFRLPAIVPLVLYNGASSWTACRRFRETLDGEEWFGGELLDFQYVLIDVHHYDEEQLRDMSNLIGVVFLLDRTPDPHTFMAELEQLTPVLEKLPPDVFPLFQTWIKIVTGRGLSREHQRQVSEMIDQFTEPREARAMVSNLEKAFEQFEWKAEQQGIEKGIEKGIGKVAVRMLEKGMDTSTIAEMTGLTKEEVEKLKSPR